MRGLNLFQSFDWEKFSEGKIFMVTGISEWKDYDTKEHLGTKVNAIIFEDNTNYDFKDGKEFTNRFEKIDFKVNKDMSIPLNSKIIPKVVKATVYGEYRNKLSIKCKDIAVVPRKENP